MLTGVDQYLIELSGISVPNYARDCRSLDELWARTHHGDDFHGN
jgi:hypothetical protein